MNDLGMYNRAPLPSRFSDSTYIVGQMVSTYQKITCTHRTYTPAWLTSSSAFSNLSLSARMDGKFICLLGLLSVGEADIESIARVLAGWPARFSVGGLASWRALGILISALTMSACISPAKLYYSFGNSSV